MDEQRRARDTVAAEPGDVRVPLQLMRAVAESMGDGLVVADLDHRFIVFNQAARRILGVGPTAATPEAWSEKYGLYWPDPETRCQTANLPLIRAMRGESDTMELFVRNERNPEGIWVSCTLSPLIDEHGAVTGGITVFRDITQARREKSELIENRRRLEYAQRVGRVGCWEWDLIHDVVSWTDEHFRLFGLDPRTDKASYETFIGLIHKEDQARVSAAIRRALNERRTFDVDYRAVMPDGSIRYFSGQGDVLCDVTGGPAWMIGVTHDITSMKVAETALRDSETRLRAVIDNTTDAVFIKDLDGRYVLLNPASAALQNRRIEEVIGRDDFDRFPEETARRLRAIDQEVIATGRPVTVEETVEVRPGEPRVFSSVKVPYTDEHGVPIGIIGISRDITEQKAYGEQIQRAKEQLSEAQHLAHIGSWELDLGTGRLQCSDELKRIYGFPPDRNDLSMRDLLQGVTVRDRPRVERLWSEALARRRPFETEFRIARPDGTERVVSAMARILVDPHGAPQRAIGTVQDVTERSRLEKALKDNEVKLRAIIEHSSDTIYIKNRAGYYIFANQAASELFGVPLDQLASRQPETIFDAATTRRIRAEDRLVLVSGKPREFEQDIRLRDGRTACFLTVKYPYCTHEGEPDGIIGVARDITARKRIEEEIRRNNALLVAQQEAALDGILAVDEKRSVIGYNQRFLQLWSIPPAEVADHSDHRLIEFVRAQLQDPDEFEAIIEHLYEQPYRSSRDEIKLKDGRVFDRYSAPIVSPDREFYGRVWYFRDITEQKRLEERLQNQYEKLQQLDRIKSHFVNAVTHELRTPLTSIMGYAEFLEDGIGGSLSNEQLEFVYQLENGAKRLDRLLGDLLDFARIEAGTFKVAIEEADLNRKVREIVQSLQPQAQEAQLRIEVDLPPEPNMVPMDSQRIGQVLLNLLSNAIKFTPRGGSIRVRAMRGADRVVCEVQDTGVGIAPADLPKLFNRFTQLEAGVRKGVGVGLGLSISKSIVSAHGGEVGVRSEPGKGSTFWFSLPLHPAQTPTQPRES